VILGALAFAAIGWWLYPRKDPRPNLLLVTIDTLRADHVGAYGAASAQTPTLDALASRGVRFVNALSSAPLTGPSHATILTGLLPPQHGVRDNIVFSLNDRHKTLATRLKALGYRTAAFVGAYPVAAAFGFRQGFDVFTENFKESEEPGAGAQRPANEVVDDALSWLSRPAAGPFFAWVHLYDPHAPYTPPEPYRTTFAERPYDGEIAFADAQLGRLLESLKASGRESDTIVAVVSDHGESLGEHGELTHAVLVYESTLRVPLLIAGPGIKGGGIVEARVSTADLVPTFLRLLGSEAPAELFGRDLSAGLRGERLRPEPLYAESLFGRLNCRWASLRAWVDGDFKLIDGGRTELFDLSRDPEESTNLAEQDAARVVRMREALRKAVARMAPEGDRAPTAAITREQETLIKSLGYVGGTGGGGELDQPGLPDPRDHVREYERLQLILRAHNMPLAEAAAEASAIALKDPGNPFAHNTVASLAYRAGRLREAAGAYRRALELDPDRPAVRQNYGKLLRDMGRLQESEKELRLAVEQTDAVDARTRASLAQTLALVGKTQEAEAVAAEALRIEPNDPETLLARARVKAAMGRKDEAAESFRAAAAAGEPDARIELALLLLRSGDAAAAGSEAEAVLKERPGHPWALGVLGQALVREGRRDEGLAALRRGQAARPRRPEAWLTLAEGFDAANDKAAAEACRRAAWELIGS
jgi:arylsulfatase A-like enzyme/Tfp pilus assembly protein PilF